MNLLTTVVRQVSFPSQQIVFTADWLVTLCFCFESGLKTSFLCLCSVLEPHQHQTNPNSNVQIIENPHVRIGNLLKTSGQRRQQIPYRGCHIHM